MQVVTNEPSACPSYYEMQTAAKDLSGIVGKIHASCQCTKSLKIQEIASIVQDTLQRESELDVEFSAVLFANALFLPYEGSAFLQPNLPDKASFSEFFLRKQLLLDEIERIHSLIKIVYPDYIEETTILYRLQNALFEFIFQKEITTLLNMSYHQLFHVSQAFASRAAEFLHKSTSHSKNSIWETILDNLFTKCSSALHLSFFQRKIKELLQSKKEQEHARVLSFETPFQDTIQKIAPHLELHELEYLCTALNSTEDFPFLTWYQFCTQQNQNYIIFIIVYLLLANGPLSKNIVLEIVEHEILLKRSTFTSMSGESEQFQSLETLSLQTASSI